MSGEAEPDCTEHDDDDHRGEPLVVLIAREILEMQHRIYRLERENKDLRRYEDMWFKSTQESIRHSGELIGLVLKGALNGAFTGASGTKDTGKPK